jgi:hypothetical protein
LNEEPRSGCEALLLRQSFGRRACVRH